MPDSLTTRLAVQLRSLRRDHGLSLDQLAIKCGVSRATLSRIEQAQVSPTTEVLGKLCAAYALPVSRLMMKVEDGFEPLIPYDDQIETEDSDNGFIHRSVSPPADALLGEVQECHLPPDTTITNVSSAQPPQEQHLVLLDGALTVTVEGHSHSLTAGDCLRFQVSEPCRFETSAGRGARYLLVLI